MVDDHLEAKETKNRDIFVFPFWGNANLSWKKNRYTSGLGAKVEEKRVGAVLPGDDDELGPNISFGKKKSCTQTTSDRRCMLEGNDDVNLKIPPFGIQRWQWHYKSPCLMGKPEKIHLEMHTHHTQVIIYINGGTFHGQFGAINQRPGCHCW